LLTYRLCKEMHLSPKELEEIDIQTILDWVTIMGQERELAPAPKN
jgi:hypothetical protein